MCFCLFIQFKNYLEGSILSTKKSIVLLAVIILLSAIFSYFYIDKALSLYFHNLYTSNNYIWFHETFHLITKFGEAQYSLILLFLLFLFFRIKKPIFAHKMLYLFGAVAISGILVDIIKIIAARLRPTMFLEHDLYGFVWFKLGSEFNSFPSGHSATAFALCIGLTLLYPRYKYPFLLIGVLIVMSRIILTFHYLSDTLIGALIGGLTALFLYRKLAVRNYFRP
jgi:membrane-associated phospholipid phosphatase